MPGLSCIPLSPNRTVSVAVLAVVMLVLIPAFAFAAPYSWNGNISSDWTDGNNWTPAAPAGGPGAGDDVTINLGTPNNLILITNENANSITINGGASVTLNGGSVTAGIADLAAGATLVSTGGGAVTNLSTNNGLVKYTGVLGNNLSVTTGAAQSYTNLEFTGGNYTAVSAFAVSGSLTMTGGTLSIGGANSLTVTGDATGAGTLNISTGITRIGGALSVAGFSQGAGGTVRFDTTAGSLINAYTFENVQADVLTLQNGNWTVNGDLTLTGELRQNGNTLTVLGSINGAGTLTSSAGAQTRVGTDFTPGGFNPSTGTVILNGGNAASLGGYTFNNLRILKSAGAVTVTTAASVTVAATFTMTRGTFTLSSGDTLMLNSNLSLGNNTRLNVAGNAAGFLDMNNNAVAINISGGVLDLQAGPGPGQLINAGNVAMVLSAGTLNTSAGFTVDDLDQSGGTFNHNGGAVQLGAGQQFSKSGGQWNEQGSDFLAPAGIALSGAAGTDVLNMSAGSIRTSGSLISIGIPVQLQADATLDAGAGGITLTAAGSVNADIAGNHTLFLNSSGAVQISGQIGNAARLNEVNSDANGSMQIAANITSNRLLVNDAAANITAAVTLGNGNISLFNVFADFVPDVGGGGDLILNYGLDTASQATTFQGTVNLNSITQSNGTGIVEYQGDVTLVAASSLFSDTVFTGAAGLQIVSSGALLTIGSLPADSDSLSLPASLNSLTFTGAGSLVLNADTRGNRDLVFALPATVNGSLGGAGLAADRIGDGAGASIAVTTGAVQTVRFAGTVRTAEGITQSNGSGPVQFDSAVTISGAGTDSILEGNGDVTLDGLTWTSAGLTRFGSNPIDGFDVLSLSGGNVTFAGTGSLAVYSELRGGRDLFIQQGADFFNNVGPVGFEIGDGLGPAISVATGAGEPVNFRAGVRTNSGITQTPVSDPITFYQDVHIGAGDTASTFNAGVVLDGLSCFVDNDITFGNGGAGSLTLSTGAVTIDATGNDSNVTMDCDVATSGGAVDFQILGNPGGAATIQANGTLGTLADPIAVLLFRADNINLFVDSIYTSGTQTYDSDGTNPLTGTGSGTEPGGTLLDIPAGGGGTINSSGSNIYFDDLYVDTTVAAVFTGNPVITCDRFTFYNGSLDISGATLRTYDDFVVMGYSSANEVDAPFASVRDNLGPAVGDYEYPEKGSLRYDPGLSWPANPGGGSYSADFNGGAGLNGTTITVDADGSAGGVGSDGLGDFYIAGTDLNPPAGMTLNLPENLYADPVVSGPWGMPYAIVLHSAVTNCSVAGNAVIAADIITAASTPNLSVANGGGNSTYTTAGYIQPDEANAYAAAGTGTGIISSYGFDFTPAYISSAAIVRDNLIRITFSEPVRNYADAIDDQIRINALVYANPATPVAFGDAFLDGDPQAATGLPAASQAVTTGGGTYYFLREIYLELPGLNSWRTDASGSAAAGAVNGGYGDPASTDGFGNTGVDGSGAPGTLLPDIQFALGAFFGSSGADYVISDYIPAVSLDSTYNLAGDQAGPVLWKIEVGRRDHVLSLTPADTTDGHNYFGLHYSEPVAFGDDDGAAGPATAVAGFSYGDGNPADPLVSAQTTMLAAGQIGGDIHDDGSGTINVSGYFDYSNAAYAAQAAAFYMKKGNRDGAGSIDVMRKTSPGTLEIYLAALWNNVRQTWPGWVFNVLDPYAADGTVAGDLIVLPNDFVTDAAGNVFDVVESDANIEATNHPYIGPKGAFTTDFTSPPAPAVGFWDVYSPGISAVNSVPDAGTPFPIWQNRPLAHEILARDTGADQKIDTLDFFIQDNMFSASWDFLPSEDNAMNPGSWNPANHPFDYTTDRTVANPDGSGNVAVPRGLRDNTLDWSGTWAERGAFRIGVKDTAYSLTNPYPLTSFPTSGFNTAVGETYFTGGGNNIDPSDSYFSLSFDGDTFAWSSLTELVVTYDASVGYATDLAGNLMSSSGYTPIGAGEPFQSLLTPADFSQNPYPDILGESGKLIAVERTPPRILLALGAVGGNRIFLKFSEPVFAAATLDAEITAADFQVNNPANPVLGLQIVKANSDLGPARGAEEVYLTLQNPITTSDVFNAYIQAVGTVYDKSQNQFSLIAQRNISDIGINILAPVSATDGIQQDATRGAGFSSLRVFDGSLGLDDLDITVYSALNADFPPALIGTPVDLVYDVNIPAARLAGSSGDTLDAGGGQYWAPVFVPGLVLNPDPDARLGVRIGASTAVSEHLISAGDPEIRRGVTLEFIYRFGGLYTAVADNPDNPLALRPWRIKIGDIADQRAGVAILNNVINPSAGDQTILNYELTRPGLVMVNIFTLDGDLVRVLQRGRQGIGLYNLAWDGRNSSGEVVARGFYFIRIVAPGVDEFRKVLVVKN